MVQISDRPWAALGLAAGVFLCYCAIFIQFFPNGKGCLGHDYATFLPALQDGFIWYHANGMASIPWFTPSFFGGFLQYANPQNGYFTLPQFLAFVVDPLIAVQTTFVLFAGGGFLGFYHLLRRSFGLARPAALTGATLFLFNGFYAHRMLIGHFGAHPFMLLPWIMSMLMGPAAGAPPPRAGDAIADSLKAGFLLAYMVQTWFVLLMVPALAAIVLVALLGALSGGRPLAGFWARLAGAGAAGLGLSAAKLAGLVYLSGQFDRSALSLPGAETLAGAAGLMVRSLFVSPAFDPGRSAGLGHLQWIMERHEWEFSLTPVALILLLVGGLSLLGKKRAPLGADGKRARRYALLGGIFLLLALPVLLNTHQAEWHRFLKQLPVIKDASSLIRWFIIPLPFTAAAAALVLDRLPVFRCRQWCVAVAAMIGVVAVNAAADRTFYQRQAYSPWPVVDDFYRVASGRRVPVIRGIFAFRDKTGRTTAAPIYLGPNDAFVRGLSPLIAYDPLFGYHAEAFPVKTLHPGPVMAASNGVLNLKNPACYLWPAANGCRPGDPFRVDQVDDAEAFRRYRPFHYTVPFWQRAANWINLAVLAAGVLWLVWRGLPSLGRRGVGRQSAVDSH